MKQIIIGFCAWVIGLTLAVGGLSQTLPLGGGQRVITPPSIAFGSSGTTNGGTYTFGTAATARVVVTSFSWTVNQTGVTTSGVTIGGVAATLATRTKVDVGTPASIGSDIWYASLASGTSGAVTVTFSGPTLQTIAIGTYSIYNPLSGTPTATGTSLVVPFNGIGVANTYSGNVTGSSGTLAFNSPFSVAWSQGLACTLRGGATLGPVAAQTVSVNYTTAGCSTESIRLLVAAAWN